MWQAFAKQGMDMAAKELGGPVQSGSNSTSPFSGGMFDASGMNVNFGPGNISSERAQSETDSLTPYLPYVVMAVIALVALRYLKNKKG